MARFNINNQDNQKNGNGYEQNRGRSTKFEVDLAWFNTHAPPVNSSISAAIWMVGSWHN
jgi:hypothetical protein